MEEVGERLKYIITNIGFGNKWTGSKNKKESGNGYINKILEYIAHFE